MTCPDPYPVHPGHSKHDRPMRVTLLANLLLCGFLAGMVILPGTAMAACTDAPAPGVNWQSCFHDGRPFKAENLEGAILQAANFARSDFTGSNMRGIDGRRTKFFSATMQDVDLSGANLARADLTKADLTGASFKNANLERALLYRATLRGADFTGANLKDADFMFADLSGATWIDGETICAEGSRSRCQ